MNMQTWWLFVMMTFVASGTPGPNMIMVMSHSARFGIRAALFTMAGSMTALLTMMSLAAAGLGALLQAFPAIFDVLRWIGAAYLAYLGFKSWRAPVSTEASPDGALEAGGKPESSGVLFRRGLLVAAGNPKAILFAAAFCPQFISTDLPQIPQFAILLATLTTIELCWYFVYAGSGRRLSVYLRRATVLKAFNRITGGTFVGFAALMAAARN